MASSPTLVVVSTDLMSSTRIADTAALAGYAVSVVESTPSEGDQAELAVLDVAALPGEATVVVTALRAANPAVRIVAVYRHTDPQQARAARAAGCELVLNRAQFYEDIPAALGRLAGGATGAAARPG